MFIELAWSTEYHGPNIDAHVPPQHFMLSLGTGQKTLEASDLYVSMLGFYFTIRAPEQHQPVGPAGVGNPSQEGCGPTPAAGSNNKS